MDILPKYIGMFLDAITKVEAQLLVIVGVAENLVDSGVEGVHKEHPLSNEETLVSFLAFAQDVAKPTSGIPAHLHTELINLNKISQDLDIHLFFGGYRTANDPSKLIFDVTGQTIKQFSKWTQSSKFAGSILKAAFMVCQRGKKIKTGAHMMKDLTDDQTFPSLDNFVDVFDLVHLQVSTTAIKFVFAFSFIYIFSLY